jgi:hypothetical protein
VRVPRAAALALLASLLAAGCYDDPDSTFPDRTVQDDSLWVGRTATYGDVIVRPGATLRIVESRITVEEDFRVRGDVELVDSVLTFRRPDTNNQLVVLEASLTASGSSIQGLDAFIVQDGTVRWDGGSIDSEQVSLEGASLAWFEGVELLVHNQPENAPGVGSGFNVPSGSLTVSNSTLNDDATYSATEPGHLRLVGSSPVGPQRLGAADGLEEADWVVVHLVDALGRDVANRSVASRWLQTMEDESEAVTDEGGEALLAVVHLHWDGGLPVLRDPHAVMVGGPTQGQPFPAQAHLPRLEVLVPEA